MGRSCGDCIHYRICYVAKCIRDLYNNLPNDFRDSRRYDEIIKWARSFAELCLLFKKGDNIDAE